MNICSHSKGLDKIACEDTMWIEKVTSLADWKKKIDHLLDNHIYFISISKGRTYKVSQS